jgi:hypothetical protein
MRIRLQPHRPAVQDCVRPYEALVDSSDRNKQMGIVDYARRMSIGLCDGPRQMERRGITELGVGRYKRLPGSGQNVGLVLISRLIKTERGIDGRSPDRRLLRNYHTQNPDRTKVRTVIYPEPKCLPEIMQAVLRPSKRRHRCRTHRPATLVARSQRFPVHSSPTTSGR